MRRFCLALAVAFCLPYAAAQADDMLSGSEIEEVVSGNTVAGAMLESGEYAEFYDADGTIRGDGYTGEWMIDGDTMCFSYDGETSDCWNVTFDGETIQWVQDGAVAGDGAVMTGNPEEF